MTMKDRGSHRAPLVGAALGLAMFFGALAVATVWFGSHVLIHVLKLFVTEPR